MSKTLRQSPVLDRWKRPRLRGATIAVTVPVVLFGAAVNCAMGATIYVTTLSQKISQSGGCSLQEAIYSANFDDNVAVGSLDLTDPPSDVVVRTQCVAGSGDDTIVLARGAVFELTDIVRGGVETNPTGRTATPLITTNITIRGSGSVLRWAGDDKGARLFSVARNGNLTIHDLYIKDFFAKGGDGGNGGGGGLGAGGAIYVDSDGVLTIDGSTFDGNGAIGGNGAQATANGGGGGGGLGGNGGSVTAPDDGFESGAGGGGSLGDGGGASFFPGGGGGTYEDGHFGFADHAKGGHFCGGDGAEGGGIIGSSVDGADGSCAGGGGGGGGGESDVPLIGSSGNGGNGNYGGGGGGGYAEGNGGHGGFGGGGGAGGEFGTGGDGGFGGGGGSGSGFITGGPGGSLRYGGHAGDSAGGGGGALGGAIFSVAGTVTIKNSTFTRNFAVRGEAGGEGAANGADAGGAIFSLGGSLTVENTTISGNETTGPFGGIAYDNRSLPCFGACLGEAGLLALHNTIIAHNGVGLAAPEECVVFGPDANLEVVGAGNLVGQNSTDAACPGVVSSADPQLGPLQDNGGLTPTMAITQASPAWNTADADTSLPFDQRHMDRPRMGGFDIGAFELCVDRFLIPCIITPPALDTKPLRVAAAAAGGGTTTPAPGDYAVDADSVILLSALPAANHCFVGWSGDVTDPSSATTTVVVDQAQDVTANFASVVASSIGTPLLHPPNHDLVNVGLTATGNCGAPATFQVQVFSDEDDQRPTDKKDAGLAPDAASIAVGTLKLRTERAGDGDGRVYLVVVRASDAAGNTGFSCTTVVVPHDSSKGSAVAVNNQAAAARAYCEANGAPPPGYFVIGDRPV